MNTTIYIDDPHVFIAEFDPLYGDDGVTEVGITCDECGRQYFWESNK